MIALNVCFQGEIKKKNSLYTFLSGTMTNVLSDLGHHCPNVLKGTFPQGTGHVYV